MNKMAGQLVGQTVGQTVKSNGRSNRSVSQRALTGHDRPMTDHDRPLPSLVITNLMFQQFLFVIK